MACPLSCTFSLLTFTILLHLSSITAQNGGNITVGQSLLASANGSSWLSPFGDFAFGFHQLPNNNNLYLLAIWYAKIPDTIVWCAYAGNPVTQGSSVTITADEGLVLSDPQGINLWNTFNELRIGIGVSYGFMNDNGNFALKRSDNSNPVWQSFDHPTDTLLPGQSLDINGMLTSRLSQDNYTAGRFQYRLTSDGRMVLNVRDLTSGYAYREFYTSDKENSGQTQRYVYNESGYQYILRKNGSRYNMLPDGYTPAQDYYQRTTLSFTGMLIWYNASKTSVSDGWNIFQEEPDDICRLSTAMENLGSGICGSNNICSTGDDRSHRTPTCTCAPGYSLVDPNQQFGICKPNFKLQSCGQYTKRSMEGEYNLVRLPDTDFTFNDYERLDFDNEADCKNACLNDCFCAAASFNPSGGSNPGCWKKKAPLYNGVKQMGAPMALWIKTGNDNTSDTLNPDVPVRPAGAKNKVNSLMKVLFGSSAAINLLLLGAIGLGFFLIYQKKLKPFKEGHRKTLLENNNIHCFSYEELKEATNGFKEELGRGSFGIVYKGMISGGFPTCVAVKKLDRISSDTDKEFKAEVNAIGRTHHKNLVQLIGYCNEEDQRLLVYEYMSNGSLADYLFSDLRPRWIDRVQIAQGIARGLLYLHEECNMQTIHCDIKPQNILLDEYHNARIADFGLAKLLVLNQTHTNTAIRGTKGYVAPEWFRNKPVTVKVDVYSFGVLLLEIICCRKSVCIELVEEEGAILTDWAIDCYQANRLDSLVNNDMEALNDILRLKRFVMISLWCTQEEPSLRPTMRTVTQMLEGVVEVPNKIPGPTASFQVTTQH